MIALIVAVGCRWGPTSTGSDRDRLDARRRGEGGAPRLHTSSRGSRTAGTRNRRSGSCGERAKAPRPGEIQQDTRRHAGPGSITGWSEGVIGNEWPTSSTRHPCRPRRRRWGAAVLLRVLNADVVVGRVPRRRGSDTVAARRPRYFAGGSFSISRDLRQISAGGVPQPRVPGRAQGRCSPLPNRLSGAMKSSSAPPRSLREHATAHLWLNHPRVEGERIGPGRLFSTHPPPPSRRAPSPQETVQFHRMPEVLADGSGDSSTQGQWGSR